MTGNKKIFILLIIAVFSIFSFFNSSKKTASAAPVLGTVEISYYGRLWLGACFDQSGTTYSVDAACKQVYGPLAKEGARVFYSLDPSFPPPSCNPYIRPYCEYGDTCDWFRYECLEITPPSCSISASPNSIMEGSTENVTVSWTTSNATTATLNGTSVTPNIPGSQIFTGISGSTTYTLEVTGDTVVPACVANVEVFVPPTGGLVPCGRIIDNPDTDDIIESNQCSLCAMFYMLKNVINFIMTLAIGISVFILVIAGLIYAFSAGTPKNVKLAKSAITSAVIGVGIIFIAWLVIAVILQGMGYANMTQWNQVNCVLPN